MNRTDSMNSSSTTGSNNDPIVMNKDIAVTFHRMATFTDTFEKYFEDFQMLHSSLSPKFNRDSVFKAGAGAGRSGSFFFYSHDRKFIIKTMTKGELKVMLELLPNYSDHFKNCTDSMIAKIFGVFTVKTSQTGPVHIMLMENTIRLKESENLKYIFDLKGSTVDRYVTGSKKPSSTLKDLNFLRTCAVTPDLTKMHNRRR